MKSVLLSLILLFSLSGISQTTVFNEGWNTQPKKLITAGKTAIVFETNTTGLGRYGKILKYKVSGDEYIKLGEIWVPEILIDYRFDSNQRLQVIGLQADHCDYYDSTSFWVGTIDTGSFSIDTARQMLQLGSFNKVAFANDSTLILTDGSGSKLYSLKSNQFIKQGLITSCDKDGYLNGVFDGRFILSYSKGFGLLLENVNQHLLGTHVGLLQKQPVNSFSYGTDSLLLVTDSAVYKTDTNLYSFKRISIPSYHSGKIIGTNLYLVNGNGCYTLSLPSVTLISIDTLKGLPLKFKLTDVFPVNQKLAALALAQKNLAFNEMVVKADMNSRSEVERSEIRVDSIFPIDTIAITTPGGLFNYEVLFRVYCYNDGSDTIKNFQCLYSDYPYSSICGPLLNSFKQLKIPPGATKSFTQSVKIDGGKNNVCFHVSAPNSNLEDDLTNNKGCISFTIGLAEFSEEPLVNIFPNPTNGKLHIEANPQDIADIGLFGLEGRKFNVQIDRSSENGISLNMSNLVSGIYFLKIQMGDQVIIKKVIKN